MKHLLPKKGYILIAGEPQYFVGDTLPSHVLPQTLRDQEDKSIYVEATAVGSYRLVKTMWEDYDEDVVVAISLGGKKGIIAITGMSDWSSSDSYSWLPATPGTIYVRSEMAFSWDTLGDGTAQLDRLLADASSLLAIRSLEHGHGSGIHLAGSRKTLTMGGKLPVLAIRDFYSTWDSGVISLVDGSTLSFWGYQRRNDSSTNYYVFFQHEEDVFVISSVYDSYGEGMQTTPGASRVALDYRVVNTERAETQGEVIDEF